MIRRMALLAVVPLVLALAACGPVAKPTAEPSAASIVTSTPTSTPTPTPSATIIGPVNAEDYLLEGGLNVDTDGDGFWSAHYGFYFEASRSARCDIFIFSGDEPVASCSIIPGNEAKVTYPLPADAQCDYSTSNPHDGYAIALGAKPLYPAAAGFSGCQQLTEADYFTAETKLLPSTGEITVAPFHCAVTDDQVNCDYPDRVGSFTFGLATAVFAG